MCIRVMVGGDLDGMSNAAKVVGIQERPIEGSAPGDGFVLVSNDSAMVWAEVGGAHHQVVGSSSYPELFRWSQGDLEPDSTHFLTIDVVGRTVNGALAARAELVLLTGPDGAITVVDFTDGVFVKEGMEILLDPKVDDVSLIGSLWFPDESTDSSWTLRINRLSAAGDLYPQEFSL